MMGMIPCIFLPFFLLISVCGTILWIWTIIDCATKEPSDGNDKVIWILVIIFTNWIGSLIYIFVRRPERIRLYGR